MKNCDNESCDDDHEEEELLEGLGDFQYPPKYTPLRNCFPPFPSPAPSLGLTEQLLQALLKSHEAHIQSLKEAQQRELDLQSQVQSLMVSRFLKEEKDATD